MEKEADGCRSAAGRDNRHTRPYQSMDDAEGLGVRKYKEHKSTVKTVLDFEEEAIHSEGWMRLRLWLLFGILRHLGHSIMPIPLFLQPH